MDYEIRSFQYDIVARINKSELPIEVKRLVLLEVLSSLTDAANGIIEQQRVERSANEQSISED